MSDIIQLSIVQLASAFIFIIVMIIIVNRLHLSREREILFASLRMTVQLTVTGFLLVYIFEHPHPLITLAIVLLMESFAVYNIYQRIKRPLNSKIKCIIALSMFSGTLTSLIYFIFVIVRIQPWYNPQYFIPIAGMLIGNSMTGISLAVSRLVNGMYDKATLIENALMLGATKKMASREIVEHAFDSAILPTINSMVGMGIIFLPGMMTGQILSGVSPLTAIEYQIAIMLGIAGSVSLTSILFVQLAYRTFFNNAHQLTLAKPASSDDN